MSELKYKVKNTKDYSLQESLQRLMTQAFTVSIDDNKNEITLFHVDEIPFEKQNLAHSVLQPFFEDDLNKCADSVNSGSVNSGGNASEAELVGESEEEAELVENTEEETEEA